MMAGSGRVPMAWRVREANTHGFGDALSRVRDRCNGRRDLADGGRDWNGRRTRLEGLRDCRTLSHIWRTFGHHSDRSGPDGRSGPSGMRWGGVILCRPYPRVGLWDGIGLAFGGVGASHGRGEIFRWVGKARSGSHNRYLGCCPDGHARSSILGATTVFRAWDNGCFSNSGGKCRDWETCAVHRQ